MLSTVFDSRNIRYVFKKDSHINENPAKVPVATWLNKNGTDGDELHRKKSQFQHWSLIMVLGGWDSSPKAEGKKTLQKLINYFSLTKA